MSSTRAGSRLISTLWHVGAVLLVLLAPSQLWSGQPIWYGNPGRLLQVIAVAAAYVVGAALLRAHPRNTAPDGRFRALGRTAVPLAGAYLVILSAGLPYSRGMLLLGTALVGLLLWLPDLARRHSTAATALAGISLLALVVLGLGYVPKVEEVEEAVETELIATNRHVIEATHLPTVGDTIWGGGLGHLGADMLLVTGGGEFWRIGLSTHRFAPARLDFDVPLNREDFEAAADTTVRRDRFRVTGLLVQPSDSVVRLVVSHHYWRRSDSCFVLRFSEALVTPSRLVPGGTDPAGPSPEWRTLYDTRPCLSLKSEGDAFAGQQSGGRLAALGDSALLATVGDHQFDGVNSENSLPQARDNDYGKTLIIPANAPTRVFTHGHRNPQGLLITPMGEIWLTEHGPKGGDELNLLEEGADYGWPLHTYGTAYGKLAWPPEEGVRSGFTEPVFAWVPSIGVSSLISLQGTAFRQWTGDLLVASLGAESLFRLHRVEDRFVFAEPIEVDRRVRDLAEAADGRIVLWSDGGLLSILSEADQQLAETLDPDR